MAYYPTDTAACPARWRPATPATGLRPRPPARHTPAMRSPRRAARAAAISTPALSRRCADGFGRRLLHAVHKKRILAESPWRRGGCDKCGHAMPGDYAKRPSRTAAHHPRNVRGGVVWQRTELNRRISKPLRAQQPVLQHPRRYCAVSPAVVAMTAAVRRNANTAPARQGSA